MRKRTWLAGAAAPLIAAHVALLALGDPAEAGGWFFSVMAVAFGGLAWAMRALGSRRLTAVDVLWIAALLRILVLPMTPSLSDDVYRYVWDGRTAWAGWNPYALAPDAPELAGLRDEIWAKTAHRDVETVYPPFALGLFSIAAATPAPVVVLKLILGLLDLVGVAALLHLAASLGIHLSRVVAFAWNPLVVLEGAGMGHVDAAGVACVLVAAAFLFPRPAALRGARSALAATAAALGVLAKLVPVVVLPLWLLRVRSALFAGVCSGVLVVAALPVLLTVGGVPPGLVRYGVSWEFNGPIFEPLARLLHVTPFVDALRAAWSGVEWLTGQYEALDGLYAFLYPELVAKVLLAAGVLALVGASLRSGDTLAATSRIFRWVLVFSATLYPWYLTWALPWAALEGRRPWVVLSASVQLAYVPLLLGHSYWPWVYLGVWLPFAASLALDRGVGRTPSPAGEEGVDASVEAAP